MKRVVSISLGSSKGDKVSEVDLLGERYRIERIGTDGDFPRFQSLFRELDGRVDALGVGGADIYVVVGDRKYAFTQIQRVTREVRNTPVVDGSGLKHTLERRALQWLQDEGVVKFGEERALLVSAVDRYGMAQTLDRLCSHVIYGDLMFGVGLPIPLRRYRSVERLGRILLPIITRLPIQWFYPTGEKQEKRTPKFGWAFDQSTFLCGDTHLLRRFAPDRLEGKTVLTQTLRSSTIEEFRLTGLRRLIATTPVIDGETFATNVMEAVLVAHLGKAPESLGEADYNRALDELGWRPTVLSLTGQTV